MNALQTTTMLFETTNVEKVNYLLNNHRDSIDRDHLCLLSQYRDKAKITDTVGTKKVTYGHSKKRNGMGRLYARGPSLQNLPSQIRNFIAGESYHDIDIVNCNPSLLLNICSTKDIECPLLTRYCSERDDILKDYADKFNVTAKEVKTVLLGLVFGMSISTAEHQLRTDLSTEPFFEGFKAEVTRIAERLVRDDAFSDIVDTVKAAIESIEERAERRRKKANTNASVLNLILEVEEAKVLEHMYKFFTHRKYKVGTLIFDGLLVERKECDLDASKLRECEAFIQESIGTKVVLLEKPMTSKYEMKAPTPHAHLFREYSEPDYIKTKADFEQTHFKIAYPLTYCKHVGERLDEMSEHAIRNTYRNMYTFSKGDDGKDKKAKFVTQWLDDPAIRTYERIDFDPSQQNDDNIFNLFTGFPLDDVAATDGDIEPVLNHLRILVKHDESHLDWLLDYLAHILHRPEEKPGIAIVFMSKEGAGKNILLDWIGSEVFGRRYYFTSAKMKDFVGQFAIGTKNKLLISINETKGSATSKYMELLKSLITDVRDTVETKGVQAYEVNNYSRVLFLTNNRTPLPVTNSTRRIVAFECSDEKCGDYDYFSALKAHLDKPETKTAFFQFLKARKHEVTMADLLRQKPVTEAYKELQQDTTPRELLFLHRAFSDRLFFDDGDATSTSVERRSDTVYRAYKRYMEENFPSERAKNSIAFGQTMGRINFDKRRSAGTLYTLSQRKFEQYLAKTGYEIEV